jgi:hypothetical protein
MAKCVGPAHSTEARGRVEALNYNTWRGIRVVKRFTSPAQPQTARQLAIRALLIRFTRAWAGLTSTQRDGWNTWANDHPLTDWTNTSIRRTGANAYAGLNSRLIDIGQATVSTAPTANAPAPIAGLALTGGAGQISCAFTAAGGTATQIDLWGWGPHSAGSIAKIAKARHKSYGPAETSPLVLSGLSPGLWTIWARAISETDGQASTWVFSTATVT